MSARNDNPAMSGALGGQVERRGTRRSDVLAQEMILVSVAPLNTTGLLTNLSEDGLALQFGVPVPEIREIQADFILDGDRVSARCALAWSSPTVWGLKFIELSAAAKATICKWLGRSRQDDSTLPVVEGGLSEITDADSSFSDAMPVDVGAIGRAAKLLKTPLEFPGDVPPADNVSRDPAPEVGLQDVISPPPTQEDWVARLLTRQKLDREQRSSNIQPQPAREAFRLLQTPLAPTTTFPKSAESDSAIRELAAPSTAENRAGSGRPLTLLRGGLANVEKKWRRAPRLLTILFGFAFISFGAYLGFFYATRVSPPTPVPVPSAELGFGGVRAERRFDAPAFLESQTRTSGELLALGDNCLNAKRNNCSCPAAVEYFRSAAMLGHPGGLERLATLYSTGECVGLNRVQAYRTFQQALASDANPWVQWNLEALWARMTTAERTQVSSPPTR